MTRPPQAEVVIVGAGAVGTAAALELSRRGRSPVVLEQFDENHSRGSSHGPTRIFRMGYEDPTYVLLARQSLTDWERLQRDSKETLIEFTGGLDIGSRSALTAAALQAADVEYETLDASAVLERFGVRILPGTPAIFQAQTGVIAAARTVEVQSELARMAGAQFHYGVKVGAVAPSGDGAVVQTDSGEVAARVVVLAAGPWSAPVAAGVGWDLPLVVTQQQVCYLEPSKLDVVVIQRDDPVRYALPQRFGSSGVRAGVHALGSPVDPDAGPFEPDEAEARETANWLSALVGEDLRVGSIETCLYTNAPDEEFIIERRGGVILVAACSGHGFKFAPRLGRAVADVAEHRDPGLPGSLGAWWRN